MVNYIAKIVILGQGGVGKTSLIRRYVQRTFSNEYIKTIGSNFLLKKIQLKEGMKMTMQLWDLSGQDSFRNIRPQYYLNSRGGILVFDLTRHTTLESLENWYSDFTQKTGDVPLMVFGNKSDLKEQIEVQHDEGKMVAQKFGAEYLETSALNGTGVESGFLNLAWKVVDHFAPKHKMLA
ncbi:MAG: Rab family GTPase [Candidatus Hodarchaeales archaeon]|jgi:small GTP-binding protein